MFSINRCGVPMWNGASKFHIRSGNHYFLVTKEKATPKGKCIIVLFYLLVGFISFSPILFGYILSYTLIRIEFQSRHDNDININHYYNILWLMFCRLLFKRINLFRKYTFMPAFSTSWDWGNGKDNWHCKQVIHTMRGCKVLYKI